MLSFLKIADLAIVEDASIEPGPGLNVLTGETGAGKSIIVDALGLILGERGSPDLVRSGRDRLVVEAQFDLRDSAEASRVLRSAGLDPDPDLEAGSGGVEIVVRREQHATGRGRLTVNGRTATLSALRALGRGLADVHGQGAPQSLLGAEGQREALDRFAGTDPLRARAAGHCALLRDLAAELEDLSAMERNRAAREELLRAEIAAIEAAGPRRGEEEELRREESLLRHAEEVTRLAGEAFSLLSEQDDSVVSLLGAARERAARLSAIDPGAAEVVGLLQEAGAAVAEAGRSLAGYGRALEGFDAGRLEQVATRLALLDRLKRRHGGGIEEVLEALERARADLSRLGGAALRLASLPSEVTAARQEWLREARELSERRRRAAGRLDKALGGELASLGMPGTRVHVVVSPDPEERPSAAGIDDVEFLIAPNRGEEERPLARIASGGELSRAMLALCNVTGPADDGRTLVFDEVDSGIGGRVAEVVGERLSALGRSHQVICVTHLPQIAAFADRHFLVEKRTAGDRTRATITRLEDEERVQELARMLGGAGRDTAARHAAALMSRRGRAAAEPR